MLAFFFSTFPFRSLLLVYHSLFSPIVKREPLSFHPRFSHCRRSQTLPVPSLSKTEHGLFFPRFVSSSFAASPNKETHIHRLYHPNPSFSLISPRPRTLSPFLPTCVEAFFSISWPSRFFSNFTFHPTLCSKAFLFQFFRSLGIPWPSMPNL